MNPYPVIVRPHEPDGFAAPMTETVLDRLLDSLRSAGNISRAEQVRPAAVLWTDHDGQWRAVAERLGEMIPELLVLGEHAPAERCGPAIWIKRMLARALEEADWLASAVPIIYLPGVSRADLRAIETCPRALQPLAELQYRGLFWSQLNGRDWTVKAFLSSSRGGLNLDLSADQATQQAMHRALDVLVDTPVDDLKGRRLEASDFDALLSADPVRDLLTWMNNPEGTAKENGRAPAGMPFAAAARRTGSSTRRPTACLWRRSASARDAGSGMRSGSGISLAGGPSRR